jgi:hypothetical protein
MASRCRFVLAVLAVLLLAVPALADQVQIRVATHEGYARIAFDWPKAVGYETHLDGTTLTIHFDRPLSAPLDMLPSGLKEYIASAKAADDGKSVVVELRRPMDVKAFTVRQTIVAIDISTLAAPATAGPKPDAKPPEEKTADAAKPDSAAKPAAPKPEMRQADAASAEKPAADKPSDAKGADDQRKAETAKPAPQRSVAVGVSVKKIKGGTRVAFRWPERVDYDFAAKDGAARLTFKAPGTIDPARLAAAMPELAPKVAAQDGGPSVVLTVPDGVSITPLRDGNDVVVEIIGKPKKVETAAEPPARRQKEPAKEVTAPAMLAPAAVAEGAPAKGAKKKETPAKQSAASKDAKTKETSARDAAKDAGNRDVAATDALPPAPVKSAATIDVRFSADGDTSSLRFDWPMATGAAVYRRGSAIWIVFSAPTRLELSEPRAHGQQVFRSLDQLALSEATVLRLVARDGLNPSVRRVGTSWIVDLKTQPVQTDAPIVFEARPTASPPDVEVRVKQAGAPLRLHDPDVGDSLIVVPVADIGRGVDALQGFIDFRALPSVQGVVIHPAADDLVVRADADGVEITRPTGLTLSSERDRLLGRSLDNSHRLFDFEAWRGSDDDFLKRRSLLERAVVSAPAASRSRPRLDLARFYFASQFGAEALGVLDAIARDDPETAAAPNVRALRGAACLLAHDLHCAADDLSLHAFDKDPEAALWRGSLAAEMGAWDQASADFSNNAGLLRAYPKTLRDRFLLQAAEAELNTDQADVAKPLIEMVQEDHPDTGDDAMATYLGGRVEQAAGHLDAALQDWRKAAATNDRPSRARALYSTALAQLDAGKASKEDTIKALDAMRFSWRGDAFEFALLRRLGDLKLDAGDYRNGLAALREAEANFPDNPASKQIDQEITDRFAQVFLGKEAEDVPPLKALALYDEFHDVEPPGDRSDAIVRKLVDRLVAVDLLDRAAALLQEQVDHRLTGKDKARVATQLALLHLLDHDPDAALKALDIDVGHDLAPELARQRQQLRARADLDLGKPDEALSILAGDTTRDADRLRADVYWRGRNWPEAVKIFAHLAPELGADGKLEGDAEHLVLSWAAALALAGDQAGLGKLVETYGKAMDGTPSAKIFHVIADDTTAPNTVTDPRQIASQVAQIGELQSFMASYRQRLAAEKLSAIN